MFPSFYIRRIFYKCDKVQFVYIDMDYLKKLNEYVIPLTSAKEKYKTWDDVTASWYRIYEIVEKSEIRENDIIVDIKNRDVSSEKRSLY